MLTYAPLATQSAESAPRTGTWLVRALQVDAVDPHRRPELVVCQGYVDLHALRCESPYRAQLRIETRTGRGALPTGSTHSGHRCRQPEMRILGAVSGVVRAAVDPAAG